MKITRKTITATIAFIAMQCAWGQATGTWNLPSKNINGLNYLLCNDTEIFEDTEGVMLDNLNCWEGELELPSSVNWDGKDYPLAYISSAGFVWCETLTRISIPETVRDVLFYAIWYGNQMLYKSPFVGCVNLEAIEVHEDNPWLCSVDGVLFNKEKTQLYNYPPGSKRSHYDIPEGVQAIGSQAFAYNTSLTTVTIPNTVNRICYAAFQGSESLEQVVFSDDGITTIEELTFQGCGKLSSIVLPESLTTLGEKVFMSCSSLKKIDLPQSVRGISSTAFLSCSLDTLIIRGHIDNINNGFLTCLSESTKLYVPTSEIDRYREVFAGVVLPLERLEEPRQPLAFLEGNPIWVYKYEHISQARVPLISYWLDTGNRRFTYYFLGKQKEIDGKVYTMMGEVISRGEDELTVNHWLPVREENGVVYAFTDSLPGVTNEYYDWRYNDEQPMSYLQQGNECVLYDFSMGIGERLSLPGGPNITVESYGTYQLMDGTECRVLKTTWEYVDLYERLGYVNLTQDFGIMDPFLSMPLPTNGDVFESRLNAFFGDYVMLYKAPDVQEGLCVNDTIWTREDAEAYAPAYRADPRQEEVFSYIRQLQTAKESITFTEGQIATIVLPTVPDASKGKYYRLDRCEEGQIIFEQELQPQAHIPYIIVPSEDFSIDPSALDLAGLSNDTVSIEGISFIGSYAGETLNEPEGFYIGIIDTTPDCGFSTTGETGKKAYIGALRAYLQVSWDEPYNHGGSKGPMDKMEIVLKDNPNAIGQVANDKLSNGKCFDLSGRQLSRKPAHGIYIKDGKKIIR